jgi:hypothetical protein
VSYQGDFKEYLSFLVDNDSTTWYNISP